MNSESSRIMCCTCTTTNRRREIKKKKITEQLAKEFVLYAKSHYKKSWISKSFLMHPGGKPILSQMRQKIQMKNTAITYMILMKIISETGAWYNQSAIGFSTIHTHQIYIMLKSDENDNKVMFEMKKTVWNKNSKWQNS